jgi:hypothetical protein
MKPIARLTNLVLILSAVSAVNGATPARQQEDKPIYRHAYYLFLTGTPRGCEDCYVPLLITTEALEKLARGTTKASCVLVTTYERDSVWSNEGLFEIVPGDIEAPPRIIRFRGHKYRYQEISSVEATKLLENPVGTIPISRPLVKPLGSPGPSLGALIYDLRRVK